MYQITEPVGHSNVPAFLTKLWSLVEDPNYDHLICWDQNGKSFHVLEQALFAKEVLPLYFKHSNIASFIRQLNMYGFRKKMNVDQGGLKAEKDDLEFQHPYFIRGEEHLLEHIKRKVHKSPYDILSVSKPIDSMKVNPTEISKVLTDITSLRGKQDNMSVKLDNMKRENEALWREVANLRQKHAKQQQIVNKLIGFLVTLVGGNTRPGLKRKMPLMLPDASQVEAKSPKISEQISSDESKVNYTVQSPSASPSVTGPIIHDVTDFLAASDSNNGQLLQPNVASPLLQSFEPPSPVEKSPSVNNNHTSQSPVNNSPINPPAYSRLQRENGSKSNLPSPKKMPDISLGNSASYFPYRSTLPSESCSEMTNHLDGMQMDLNNLKDILGSPGYNFDPNILIGLFDADNPLSPSPPSNIPEPEESLFPSTSSINSEPLVGNELVQYQPTDEIPSLWDSAEDLADHLAPPTMDPNQEFIDLDMMLNTPLPVDPNEYKFPQGGVSADDLD